MDTSPLKPEAALLVALLAGGPATSCAVLRKRLQEASGGAIHMPDSVLYPARDRLVEAKLVREGGGEGRSRSVALTATGTREAGGVALVLRALGAAVAPVTAAAVTGGKLPPPALAPPPAPRRAPPRRPAPRAKSTNCAISQFEAPPVVEAEPPTPPVEKGEPSADAPASPAPELHVELDVAVPPPAPPAPGERYIEREAADTTGDDGIDQRRHRAPRR